MIERRLHLPPHSDFIREGTPVVFLGGPTSPNWQSKAASILLRWNPTLEIASPLPELVSGFSRAQRESWEDQFMTRSRRLGVISFWFAGRDSDTPDPRDHHATTLNRAQLAKTFELYEKKPFPLVIGVDPNFENGRNGELNVAMATKAMDLPLYTSLDDVLEQTLNSVPAAKNL